MTALPLHVDIEGFGIVDNCLTIGGKMITDVIAEIGSTPAYLYDARLIAARIVQLRSVLPPEVQIHYAIKANPNRDVVNFIARRVDGLDVASGGELEIALQSKTEATEISFAGPGKRDVELDAAVRAGVTVNVESSNELARLNRIAIARLKVADVAIRINPDFELKSSGMKMSGGPKPFGIDAERVPEVLDQLRSMTALRFRGFHIFSGSQNLDARSICQAQSNAVALALEMRKFAPREPSFVNVGGGFGIPYFQGDRRLDIGAIGEHLTTLAKIVSAELPSTRLVIELGRYIVGESGIYVCRVVDKKESRGTTYLVTDGGLNHHLAASGNFGQVIRKNYPVLVANHINSNRSQSATVVGPLCTPLDILADRMPLGHAEVGDLIAVFQSGAYGMSASPRDFLGHPDPVERLLGLFAGEAESANFQADKQTIA